MNKEDSPDVSNAELSNEDKESNSQSISLGTVEQEKKPERSKEKPLENQVEKPFENQVEHNPEPQPPLYTCTTRCYTCGKIISHIWMLYVQEIKKLTGGDPTNIPIRTINTQKLLSNDSKTEEGKILDRKGVIRYCCRRMILTEPVNTTAIMD